MTTEQASCGFSVGDMQWAAHVGGDFGSPEAAENVSWRWLGENPGWLVLTGLRGGAALSLSITLDVLSPFDGVTLGFLAYGEKPVPIKVFPAEMLQSPEGYRFSVPPDWVGKDLCIGTLMAPKIVISAGTYTQDLLLSRGAQTIEVQIPASEVTDRIVVRLHGSPALPMYALGHRDQRKLFARVFRCQWSQLI